jgi:predicted outer membrane repeat protein
MAFSLDSTTCPRKEQLMQRFSWLSQWMTDGPRTRRAPARKPTARFRPQVEVFERRELLSTLTVTNNLDSGNGSLRADISKAHNRDTIVFAPSLDGQTITLTSGELVINQKLTIQGPGASQLTISGGNTSRVFEVDGSSTNVILSGLTITQGSATVGGAIYNNGTLTITNSTLSGNSAVDGGNGGAIKNNGTLMITNSMLSGNSAGGAGGAIDNYADLTVSGCTLSGNSSYGEAGAIRSGGVATLTVTDSTLSGNSANGDGGAIFSYGDGTLLLSACTLSGNSAYRGGAVYDYGEGRVSGCTLSNNRAGEDGSAIYSVGLYGTVEVGNSVFSGSGTGQFAYIFGSFLDEGGNTFGP